MPSPTPTPTPTTIRIEQNNAAVRYTGSWATNSLSIHSKSGAVLAMDAGSKATLTFTGTSVKWVGYRDEWSGIASVSIDGGAPVNVDTYSSPANSQAVTYSINRLAAGTHTLTITVTGRKNASSRGYWVWIDAFDVTQ
jgi:hypothetical protein